MKLQPIIEQVKAALKLEELVARKVELRSAGRYLTGRCPFHEEKTPSFKVNVEGQWFECYGCGKKGDALSWLSFERFGHTDPSGKDFVELLKDAAASANVPWPSDAQNDRAVRAAQLARTREKILGRYVELAAAAWTPAARVDACERKPWLRSKWDEIIARWRLGYAPSLPALIKGGLTEKDLFFVGLLRRSERDGKVYPFFRKRIVIPFFERGRCVFLASRRLLDVGKDGEPLPKNTKALSMPGPNRKGVGGMPRPAGFNLDVLYSQQARECGVRLVEAPLEAICLCELGKPAVALVGGQVSDELLRRLAAAAKT